MPFRLRLRVIVDGNVYTCYVCARFLFPTRDRVHVHVHVFIANE